MICCWMLLCESYRCFVTFGIAAIDLQYNRRRDRLSTSIFIHNADDLLTALLPTLQGTRYKLKHLYLYEPNRCDKNFEFYRML